MLYSSDGDQGHFAKHRFTSRAMTCFGSDVRVDQEHEIKAALPNTGLVRAMKCFSSDMRVDQEEEMQATLPSTGDCKMETTRLFSVKTSTALTATG